MAPSAKNELEIAMDRAALRRRRERIAEAQGELLQSLAVRWVEAARLRRFLAALRRRLPAASRSRAMEAWLKWARGHAAEFDPLSALLLAFCNSLPLLG